MIIIKNQLYSLSLSEDNSRLNSLIFRGNNLLSEVQPSLFAARFIDENGEMVKYSADDCHSVKVKEIDGGYAIEYSGFDKGDMRFEIKIMYDETPFIRFRARVESALQLEWIEFPRVSVPDTFADKSGSRKILWPYNEGVIVDNITEREGEMFRHREPEYPSEGSYAMCPGMVSTPLLAVTSDNGGVYFAAHDSKDNTKAVDFYRTDDGIGLQMRLYPGINGGVYETDYDTVLGVFEGDWHDGAEIYRRWFEKYKSPRFKEIENNENLPDWYGESPVVVTYCVRGHHDTDDMKPNKLFPYINGLPVIRELSERLKSKILVILMHWEGTAPWAPPFVWPPYGGKEALEEYINALHAEGHLLGVYCSGLGWTQKSKLTDYSGEEMFKDRDLSKIMCVSPKGELPLSKICTAQRSGYDMCPSQKKCKDIMVGEVEKMAASGVDYIQLMDQNHGGTPYFCYSREHGHPPVPGKWMSEELINILNTAKASVDNKKLLFGCESAAAQSFIPEMLLSDNRFELNYLAGMSVPLYSYLYHRYLNNFMGNQVIGEGCMADCATKENLWYRLAYSFVAGDFLTLVINDEGKIQWAWGQRDFSEDYMPDNDATLDFVERLNAWRRSNAKKYLHTGKMVKPIEIITDTDFILEVKLGKKRIKPVLTSRFEAEDGSYGQIVVNFTQNTVTCSFSEEINPLIYHSPNDNGRLLESKQFELPPLSSVLLVTK